MLFLDWLREKQAKKRREQEEEVRQSWAYTRKKLQEALAAAEHHAAEEPLEPYPEKGSLEWDALDRMERDGYKPSSWLFQRERYNPVIMIGKAPPDVVELRRRLRSLWETIRWRELWNDICRRHFYHEHH